MTKLPPRSARGVRRQVEHGPAGVAPSLPSGSVYPWTRTNSADVEHLLNWAFGAQLIDANPVSGLHPLEALAAGYDWQGHSADGCYAIERRHMIGASIDVSQGPAKTEYHPAAVAVSDAVARCDDPDLMRHWARVGIRPDGWREPSRWIVPRSWKVEGETGDTETTGGNGKILYTPVRLARTASSLAMSRTTYGRWHDLLIKLWFDLSTRALGFVVMPPAAPVEPWKEAA